MGSGKVLSIRKRVCSSLLLMNTIYSNLSIEIDRRGVVVHVYCSSEPGSTPTDIQAYEDGAYGNYFD
jgi:hypothetical protein